MIKAKIMLGAAAHHYQKTRKIPNTQWTKKNGGSVFEKEFNSETEYQVYVEGMKKTFDPAAFVITEQVSQDCPFCNDWRVFFIDKTTKVYCPDCGQVIRN